MSQFTFPPLFQIRLQDNTLTMHGSRTESVGCVLRGQLVLSITEPTKFKEIKLTFQGKSKIKWKWNGLYPRYKGRTLYKHNWNFLPAKEEYHILKPDNYYWDFELVLPGHLPETIEKCQHGSVKYTLKAVAERHKFAVNLHTQRKVILLRNLLPSLLENLQSAAISNTWADKVEYEFFVQSKIFSHGDKIPITINIRPTEGDLKVQGILCKFKEYAIYTIGKNQKEDSRTISVVNESILSQQINSWNHLIEVPIPSHLVYCLYDSHNDIIQIKHRLKFYVNFIYQERLCQLRPTLPVIITSTPPNSDIMTLPAYNENDSNNSYFEDNSLNLSSKFSSSICSFDESLQEAEELSRLPSYSNISSLIPAPLADSLLPPTYDASH